MLRIDLDLWTSILNNSGLFGDHGRFLPKEWRSWTRNGKTISFEFATTKNRFRRAMFCCYSEEIAQFKSYGEGNDSIGVMNTRWMDLVAECFDLETLRLSDAVTTTHECHMSSSKSSSSSMSNSDSMNMSNNSRMSNSNSNSNSSSNDVFTLEDMWSLADDRKKHELECCPIEEQSIECVYNEVCARPSFSLR